jgi:hypothetical protein
MVGPMQIRDNIIIFFDFLFPLWFLIGYCTYTTVKVPSLSMKVLSYLKKNSTVGIVKQHIIHLSLYPLVLLFCYSWVTVYRIMTIFGYTASWL